MLTEFVFSGNSEIVSLTENCGDSVPRCSRAAREKSERRRRAFAAPNPARCVFLDARRGEATRRGPEPMQLR